MPGNLHERVVEALGMRIIDGTVAPGSILIPEDLAAEFGTGRSVMREAFRVLESLGLVAATRRVGTRVLGTSEWNVYHPQVIAWRLAGAGEGAQLRSLTELRLAVEPLAAEMAARNAAPEVGEELLRLAAQMRTLGRLGELNGFLELDIAFHALVLKGSGNEMFAKLDAAVAEILTGRTQHNLMPTHPHEEALQWHVDVADAIHGGHAERARLAMEGIMRRAYDEMAVVWS